MDEIGAIVVGAGVIGLAVARELAAAGHETLILEAAERFGTGASSRNSEVIHSGIYYPRGSWKARLCVSGRERLYAYCGARGIAHRRCGKLIVATAAEQLPQLAGIAIAARANGVELQSLSQEQACALEPQLACVGALHAAQTGIIDSHAYMLALLADAEAGGALLACNSSVTRLVLEGQHVHVGVNGEEPQLRTRRLVNCGGVAAPDVARLIEGFPAAAVPRPYFAKGNYFTLEARAPFTRLVYPVPEPGGLGIHLTLDLAGRARFGPDVEWIERPDYRVDPARGERFYAAIRRYWPALPDGVLRADYAGVRPKISGPTDPAADFRIDDAQVHGVPAVLNLFGIESPGLTASLALAAEAASRIS